MATFAERVQAIRKGLNLNQADFAKELGYSRSQIIEWEKARSIPHGDVILAIAKLANVKTGYVLGITDDPQADSSEADLSPDERLLIALDMMAKATKAVQDALDALRPAKTGN